MQISEFETEVRVCNDCRIMIWFSVFAERVFRPVTSLFQAMSRRFPFPTRKQEAPRFVCRQLISVLGSLLLDGLRIMQCHCSVLLLFFLGL